MTEEIKQVKELIESHQLDQAQQQLTRLIGQQANIAELHYLSGLIYYKQQQWGKAINAFNETLALDPKHPDAQTHIDLANSILGYFNPDMFNP